MTNRQTKKVKKPLQTTLGKAPGQNEKEEIDVSRLKRPIETNIYGIREILNLMKDATEELKQYITYECDIMYECRVCRSIFRSIANFILHKRNYCRIKHIRPGPSCNGDTPQEKVPPPEPPEDKSSVKGLAPIIEKLKEQQEVKQLTEELLTANLSSEKNNEGDTSNINGNSSVLLQSISTNKAAVFQTVLSTNNDKHESMQNEVMELHGILESDKVVLGPDGKICDYKSKQINTKPIIPQPRFTCSQCNGKFSTRKTLSFHVKNKHNDSRTVYICPDCKETFANAWSVFRHLYKVHRKSASQVKKLREQISNNVIRKDQETQKKVQKKVASSTEKPDEENQWLNNIEGDNDFQMCGGCGKRFERKAALQSHATMCVKRIAVCNTIKDKAKKQEEESKDKAKRSKEEKSPGLDHSEAQLKGASKRKPYLLRTYKKSSSKFSSETSSVAASETDCDTTVNSNVNDREMSILSDNSDRKTILLSEVKVLLRDEDLMCSSSSDIMESQLITSIEKDNRIEVIQEDDEEPQPREVQKQKLEDNQGIRDRTKEKSNEKAEHESTASGKFTTSRVQRNRRPSTKFQTPEKGKSNDLLGDKEKAAKEPDFRVFLKNLSEISSSHNSSQPPPEITSSLSVELQSSATDKDTQVEAIKKELSFDSNEGNIIFVDYRASIDKEIKEEDIKTFNSDENSPCLGFRTSPSTPSKQMRYSPGSGSIRINSIGLLRGFAKEPERLDDEMPVLEPSVTPPKPPKVTRSPPQSTKSPPQSTKSPPQSTRSPPQSTKSSPESTKSPPQISKIPHLQDSKSPKSPRSPRKPKMSVNRKRRVTVDGERSLKSLKRTKTDIVQDGEKVSSVLKKIASPHMDTTTKTCTSCRCSFPTIEELWEHMSAHFDWYQFQCRRCSFVSYAKVECINHTKKKHGVKTSDIDSVVLWIPVWKSRLLASTFHELQRDEELGGKLTDELNSWGEDNAEILENNENRLRSNVTKSIIYDWDTAMPDFEDLTESKSFTVPQLENSPFRRINDAESIDITDEDQDSFQVEVPEEIYTMPVFEVVDFDERRPALQEELMESGDERTNCITPLPRNEAEPLDKSPPDAANIRPTRNRMRSIKTLQSDFFYDMGKPNNKQSDTVVKTNGPLRQKKNGSSTIKKDK